jgi:hypothetical protein
MEMPFFVTSDLEAVHPQSRVFAHAAGKVTAMAQPFVAPIGRLPIPRDLPKACYFDVFRMLPVVHRRPALHILKRSW